MEKNTFTTSTYIDVSADAAFQYLADLKNLSEWTLGNKLREQVDENTWIGSSSGSKQPLYYQVYKITELPFPSFEWRIGTEYNKYHAYPVFLFPSEYAEPGSQENGTYFHWLSFVSPLQRTPLIMDGFIDIAHTSECRALKAVLERAVGHRAPASGRLKVKTSSIYINAPFELLIEYLSDLTNMNNWCNLYRLHEIVSSSQCTFLDEYTNPVEVRVQTHMFSASALVDFSSLYVDTGLHVKTPAIVVPCAHAFGESEASGCILHRLTFVPLKNTSFYLNLHDNLAAENLNIKRLSEQQAGNFESLAQGLSYIGPEWNNTDFEESR